MNINNDRRTEWEQYKSLSWFHAMTWHLSSSMVCVVCSFFLVVKKEKWRYTREEFLSDNFYNQPKCEIVTTCAQLNSERYDAIFPVKNKLVNIHLSRERMGFCVFHFIIIVRLLAFWTCWEFFVVCCLVERKAKRRSNKTREDDDIWTTTMKLIIKHCLIRA